MAPLTGAPQASRQSITGLYRLAPPRAVFEDPQIFIVLVWRVLRYQARQQYLHTSCRSGIVHISMLEVSHFSRLVDMRE